MRTATPRSLEPSRSKPITILLGVLGFASLLFGAFMFVAPASFFADVVKLPPSQYGGFSYHFIRDISFIYILSGIGMAVYAFHPAASTLPYLIAMSAWHVLHGALHAAEAVCTILNPSEWKPIDWPTEAMVWVASVTIAAITVWEWKRLKNVETWVTETGERKRMNSLDGQPFHIQ